METTDSHLLHIGIFVLDLSNKEEKVKRTNNFLDKNWRRKKIMIFTQVAYIDIGLRLKRSRSKSTWEGLRNTAYPPCIFSFFLFLWSIFMSHKVFYKQLLFWIITLQIMIHLYHCHHLSTYVGAYLWFLLFSLHFIASPLVHLFTSTHWNIFIPVLMYVDYIVDYNTYIVLMYVDYTTYTYCNKIISNSRMKVFAD